MDEQSGQNFDATGREFIAGGNDLHPATAHGGGEEGFGAGELIGGAAGVGANGVVEVVTGLILGGFDGRSDRLDDARDVAGGMTAGDGGGNGAALFMTDDDDEADVEVFDGVFDGADDVVVEDVAGIADDEKITEALVEIELGGDAGVGAGEDDGDRGLALGEFGAARRGLVGAHDLAGSEAAVALDEAGQRFIGAEVDAGLGGECEGAESREGGREERADQLQKGKRHPVSFDCFSGWLNSQMPHNLG